MTDHMATNMSQAPMPHVIPNICHPIRTNPEHTEWDHTASFIRQTMGTKGLTAGGSVV